MANSSVSPTSDLEAAAALVRERSRLRPRYGLVLGSGLGGAADEIQDGVAIPYADIPGYPAVGVPGHAGVLTLGYLHKVPVAVLSGRPHYYEHGSMAPVAYPVRLLRAIGCVSVTLTCAAGAIDPGLHPGDVMVISDHICLPAMMGHSPLVGEPPPGGFVNMVGTYHKGLRDLTVQMAGLRGFSLRQGVYAQVGGPQFETPAEVRLLRGLGADAVGMSAAAEAIVARHQGMSVLGLACITNAAAGTAAGPGPSHSDVLEASRTAGEQRQRVLEAFLAGVRRGGWCLG